MATEEAFAGVWGSAVIHGPERAGACMALRAHRLGYPIQVAAAPPVKGAGGDPAKTPSGPAGL